MPKVIQEAAILERTADSITFAVSEVEPATTRLPMVSTQLKLARLSRENPYTMNDPDGMLIQGHNAHALLEAVHTAWAEHRPLVLTPDILWLAIIQGLAQHFRNQTKVVRERVVLHDGMQDLVVPYQDTEPDWPQVIDDLRGQISAAAPQLHELVMQRFSTTGRDEWMAYCGALFEMAGFFFNYQLFPICGIPSITLRGSPSDWRQMEGQLDGLDRYGMRFWTKHLRKIVGQCASTAAGNVNRGFWRQIWSEEPECAVVYVTGWIAKLFPYVRSEGIGLYNKRNPLLSDQTPAKGINYTDFPHGLNRVLFQDNVGAWSDRGMVSGFIGTAQRQNTLALEPKIGWGLFRTESPVTAIDRLRLSLHLPGVDSAVLRHYTLDLVLQRDIVSDGREKGEFLLF